MEARNTKLGQCLQNYIPSNMYHMVSLADFRRGHAGIFFLGNTCLMGNDAVYQEFVLHTTLNECICGLKKGRPLLVSCRRQSDWFISEFLWSEVT